MTRHPLFGLGLAFFGTLMLTPDALLMRMSEMEGFQMVAWRGLLMGGMLILAWLITARDRRADIDTLRQPYGMTIVICQIFNSIFFSIGIAIAPVAVVLFGVAAVPVCAAILALLILGEPTRPSTWLAIVAVLGGIALAVTGKAEGGLPIDLNALLGAALGLGVAVVLALNFVVLRARPHLPILLVIGVGALIAGFLGLAITGVGQMAEGRVWAMALTGAVVLPVSFFCLSLASRYTHAANVSLLMLLETVLGPLWVWVGIGEAPSQRMLAGGVIVVVSLALYLLHTGRRGAMARQIR